MPQLTVKALAEMLKKSDAQQRRILFEQKYPKEQSQRFRTPYYRPMISGIRAYYRSGNDRSTLASLENKLQSIPNQSRRENNLRVLSTFRDSEHAHRRLVPITNSRYATSIDSLALRLSADMQSLEKEEITITYFNCRHIPLSDETATYTLEIAHWVLLQNGIDIAPSQIEFVDLSNGGAHKIKGIRSSTMNIVKAHVHNIEVIWDSL